MKFNGYCFTTILYLLSYYLPYFMQGSKIKISAFFWAKIFDLTKAGVVIILWHSEYLTIARIIWVSSVDLGTRIIYKENKMYILVCYRVFQEFLISKSENKGALIRVSWKAYNIVYFVCLWKINEWVIKIDKSEKWKALIFRFCPFGVEMPWTKRGLISTKYQARRGSFMPSPNPEFVWTEWLIFYDS